MECYQTIQLTVLISTILSASAWQCNTLTCIIHPLSLKLWKDHIEISTRSITLKTGSPFSITCDGSCVGTLADPHLKWYGPDRHWIAYQGGSNRIHVQHSFSRRFLKLHIRRVQQGDQGQYICRGWLGEERGWDIKSIRLIVDQTKIPTPIATAASLNRSRSSFPTRTTAEAVTYTTETQRSRTQSTRTQSTGTQSTKIQSTVTQSTRTHSTRTQSTGTPSTTEQACDPTTYFKCGSGECVSRQQVCDSFPDCADMSDESCANAVCTEDMIACTDGTGCVLTSQICDTVVQCNDGSDEDPDVCISN